MGTSERRQREKENLRRAILDAARDLFVLHGFDNVSMRKIAEKIEYSPTTIYLHFKDKEEIYIALATEGFIMLAERLEPFHIKVADPIERLRQAAFEYFAFAREQPHYYNIMFAMQIDAMNGNKLEEYQESIHVQAGLRSFHFIMRCVQEGIALGKIPHGDLSEENILILSHVIWASIHGVAALMLSDRTVKLDCGMGMSAASQLMEATIDNTIRGLTNCDPS